MPQSIDVAKATALIEQAEDIRTQLQEFIDALRSAAGQPASAAGGIGHPPVSDQHGP